MVLFLLITFLSYRYIFFFLLFSFHSYLLFFRNYIILPVHLMCSGSGEGRPTSTPYNISLVQYNIVILQLNIMQQSHAKSHCCFLPPSGETNTREYSPFIPYSFDQTYQYLEEKADTCNGALVQANMVPFYYTTCRGLSARLA